MGYGEYQFLFSLMKWFMKIIAESPYLWHKIAIYSNPSIILYVITGCSVVAPWQPLYFISTDIDICKDRLLSFWEFISIWNFPFSEADPRLCNFLNCEQKHRFGFEIKTY